MDCLICTETGCTYPLNEPIWQAPGGGLLDVRFTACFDQGAPARRPPTLWRYREAIPLARDEHIVSFGEGCTPLVETTLAGRPVWVKLEYLFPTGSFKDRGASVLVSKVKELGIERVVEDSSGNAGSGPGGLLCPRRHRVRRLRARLRLDRQTGADRSSRCQPASGAGPARGGHPSRLASGSERLLRQPLPEPLLPARHQDLRLRSGRATRLEGTGRSDRPP